ncbi:hypothetical protein DAPPUDRAFT_108011 [Daphnia pulex]|uniref:Uncharacterized protein n=1 Tax=Daphnia pulex TaxID=6669 RepID=E9GYV7_DAPPU|nr:hypothetical protein DAPPUDRAFT_108011 [Daphnia pulex]|eukprot:EFX75341.1 hypothetical protein DAPPUDRAFT_108011 [Daphnia pulex]
MASSRGSVRLRSLGPSVLVSCGLNWICFFCCCGVCWYRGLWNENWFGLVRTSKSFEFGPISLYSVVLLGYTAILLLSTGSAALERLACCISPTFSWGILIPRLSPTLSAAADDNGLIVGLILLDARHAPTLLGVPDFELCLSCQCSVEPEYCIYVHNHVEVGYQQEDLLALSVRFFISFNSMPKWLGIQVSDVRVPLKLRLAMVSLMWCTISLLPGLVEAMVRSRAKSTASNSAENMLAWSLRDQDCDRFLSGMSNAHAVVCAVYDFDPSVKMHSVEDGISRGLACWAEGSCSWSSLAAGSRTRLLPAPDLFGWRNFRVEDYSDYSPFGYVQFFQGRLSEGILSNKLFVNMENEKFIKEIKGPLQNAESHFVADQMRGPADEGNDCN